MKSISIHSFRLSALLTALFLAVTSLFSSCSHDSSDEPNDETPIRKTLIMYFPWSTNLLPYFYDNIEDMESALVANPNPSVRVMVFISTSSSKAELWELVVENGACRREVVKLYESPRLTTAQGIYTILNDAMTHAPAPVYAMTIGCHGMGWIPVVQPQGQSSMSVAQTMHFSEHPVAASPAHPGLFTRFFGGLSPQYQTDVQELVDAIELTGRKMQFVLFDDCYMSNIEVAYQMRHVTDKFIASASEMMMYGLPYAVVGHYLADELPDYEAICQGFYEFYANSDLPYANLAVTDCSQLDELAHFMHSVNSAYSYPVEAPDTLQNLDGYRPPIFYDMGAYVRTLLANDADALHQFQSIMQNVVLCKVNTPTFYTMNQGVEQLRTFSGLTISAPSKNSLAVNAWPRTPWAIATAPD